MKPKMILSGVVLAVMITMIIVFVSCGQTGGNVQPAMKSETYAPTQQATQASDINTRIADAKGDDIETRITDYVGRMNISGSVLIVDHGETVLDFAQGDYTGKGSDIKYGVASVTKQITATCIMKLYEENKLDIDDTLDNWFPEYRHAKKITVRQLLCQQSGIPDYSVETKDGDAWVFTDNSAYMTMVKPGNSAHTNRKIIRDMIFESDLLSEPGTEFYYSDSNYALLATIVENVSGISFHAYVRDNIFVPLGMSAAFIDDYEYGKDVVVATTDRDEFEDDYYLYKGVEFGCGDMLASTNDLYKWYKGFTRYKIVSKSSYELMTENYSPEGDLGYGYGLMISDEGDSKVLYHYGYIPSFYSSIFMVPEKDLFVSVLGNHGKGYPHTVAYIITETYAKEKGYTLAGIE